jgi:hypothetical protein
MQQVGRKAHRHHAQAGEATDGGGNDNEARLARPDEGAQRAWDFERTL